MGALGFRVYLGEKIRIGIAACSDMGTGGKSIWSVGLQAAWGDKAVHPILSLEGSTTVCKKPVITFLVVLYDCMIMLYTQAPFRLPVPYNRYCPHAETV